MKNLTTWLGVIVMVLAAMKLVLQGVVYVARRIRAARTEGKAWAEVESDGFKPATGNVWVDGAVFGTVLVGGLGALAYYLSTAR